MAYQRSYFPMETLNLTQGYGANTSTHRLSYALDFAGKDTGKDKVFAPFDCKVSKLYQPKDTTNHANTVWLTSTRKVLCPNGYYGYLTMSITHPSEISKMKLGKVYRQGEVICSEGKTGGSTGNHIHLELAKGTTAGWSRKTDGKYSEYVIKNKVKPEEYLFLRENCKVKKDTYKNKKYKFYKESELIYVVTGVDEPPLNIHKTPDFKKSTISNQGVCLKNGDEVINFFKKNKSYYIYHYEAMGYVATNYLKKK